MFVVMRLGIVIVIAIDMSIYLTNDEICDLRDDRSGERFAEEAAQCASDQPSLPEPIDWDEDKEYNRIVAYYNIKL